MKSYDNPQTRCYDLGSADIEAAGPFAIAVPPWASSARIEGVAFNSVSEAFTADTTGAGVQIGTAADADKFGDFVFGVIALTDGAEVGPVTAGNFIDLDRDGDAGAALTQLEVVLVAPTGGTPAGTGLLSIVISWY